MILLNVMRRIWSEVTRIWHKWGLWTRLSGCWGRCPCNGELQVLWNWQLSKEAIVTDSILFSQARSPWFSKPGQWHSFWEPGLFKCWSFWPATLWQPQSYHTYIVFRECGTWSLLCTSFRRTLAILGEIQRRQPPSPASSPPTLIFCLQVTLFGQSAGAMAVQNLMLSPHTKDKELFRFPEWWSGWNKSWWSQARELASCIVPMMKRFLISSSASESSGASSPSTGRQFFSPDRSSQPSLTRTSTPPSIAGRTAMCTV